jgi:hypothetical protein
MQAAAQGNRPEKMFRLARAGCEVGELRIVPINSDLLKSILDFALLF